MFLIITNLFTQHIVLDNDCCISRNVVLFFVYNLSYDVNIDLPINEKKTEKSKQTTNWICFSLTLQKQWPEEFYEKGVLKNFAKFTEKTESEACNFIKKETLAQVLSCEFCKILKNTFFTEHLQATAFYSSNGKMQRQVSCVSDCL